MNIGVTHEKSIVALVRYFSGGPAEKKQDLSLCRRALLDSSPDSALPITYKNFVVKLLGVTPMPVPKPTPRGLF